MIPQPHRCAPAKYILINSTAPRCRLEHPYQESLNFTDFSAQSSKNISGTIHRVIQKSCTTLITPRFLPLFREVPSKFHGVVKVVSFDLGVLTVNQLHLQCFTFIVQWSKHSYGCQGTFESHCILICFLTVLATSGLHTTVYIPGKLWRGRVPLRWGATTY